MGGLLAAEHVWTVVVIAGATAALVAAARLRRGPWTLVAARALAVMLVGQEVAWWMYLVATHPTRAELVYALPFQLCDAAIFVSAFALWFRRQILVEVTYFWGLAGTIQAIITPDLPQHFPSFPFIQYYVAHGGVVAAALFLVVGLGQWPRRLAVLWGAVLIRLEQGKRAPLSKRGHDIGEKVCDLISNRQEDHHHQDRNEHQDQGVNDQALRERAITAIAAIILQVRRCPPEEPSVCKAE